MQHVADTTKQEYDAEVAKTRQERDTTIAKTKQDCDATVQKIKQDCDNRIKSVTEDFAARVENEKKSHQQTKNDYENRLNTVKSTHAKLENEYAQKKHDFEVAEAKVNAAEEEALDWQVKYQIAASSKKNFMISTGVSAILAVLFLSLWITKPRDNSITPDNPAYAFINAFFKTNSFDGFNASSTLQTLVDHPVYGNDAYAWPNEAFFKKTQQLTSDISINDVTFTAADGTPFYTGDEKNKQYQMDAKIAGIKYFIVLDNKTQMDAIYKALKTEIESRYKVKVVLKKQGDWIREIHFSLPDGLPISFHSQIGQ